MAWTRFKFEGTEYEIPAQGASPAAVIRLPGVPTYGMLCPVFPDVLAGAGVEQLVAAIRPERCETVWSEPFNDRANWRSVAEGYRETSPERKVLSMLFDGPGARDYWSDYARALYGRVHAALGAEAHKHRYLLYQDGMTSEAKAALRGAPGVLFQSDETKVVKKSLPVVEKG